MLYYDREKKCAVVEKEEGKKTLGFLYQTFPGRMILWLFVIRPWFSKLGSLYQKSSLSKRKIRKFVKKYAIKDAGHLGQYRNFNEFFIRKRDVSFDNGNGVILVSPADCKVSVFGISDKLILHIKGSKYRLDDLLQDTALANIFKGGLCVVCRLCTDNYHRYHFIDDGKIVERKMIPGVLHTVRPIAGKEDVFVHNSREITVMDTKNFGKIVQIDVGALMIGKIKNHDIKEFKCGDEKGYFEFGGSTIILLIKKDAKVEIDQDVLRAHAMKMETKVNIGERIGAVKTDF